MTEYGSLERGMENHGRCLTENRRLRERLAKYEAFAMASKEHDEKYFPYGVDPKGGFYDSRAKVIRLREAAMKGGA